MTFPAPVQTITSGNTSGTGTTITSSEGWETPMAGNGIMVVAAHSDRLSNLVAPDGYVSIGEQGGNGTPVVTGFGKIADGTESSVLIDWSRSGEWAVALFEFDAQGMVVDPAKKGDGDNDSNTDTLSSTTTASVQGFAMALFASLAQNGETPSYTNDFLHFLSVLAGGSGNLVLDIAVESSHAESAGTYETTAAWTSSEGRASMCLAADIAIIDGEYQKDYQRSSSYKITRVRDGHIVSIAYGGEEVEMSGLNRGQARKWLASGYLPDESLDLEVED